ncbi:shikimate 5-dehydrogenase [Salmonella enterica subsp. enterica]|uniref:Shikimate 5-dehydrogenase n=1 Tax=Salmonella enterica I TaxID=59201 RepID=A0A379W9N1_SALET|nr:shikimate 5-dehydrogenase [Salmonella enterica subsp. enterica]
MTAIYAATTRMVRGHIRAIKESGFDIRGKTMVLLGAGGAATAIGAQAAIEGIKEIKLFNRKDDFFEKSGCLCESG